MCLWPDFHPEKWVVDDHQWYYDLIIHGGYYFVATFILLLLRMKLSPVLTGGLFFVLSVVLELLQYFSNNRSVDIVDIASNLLGIVCAVAMYWGVQWGRKRNWKMNN